MAIYPTAPIPSVGSKEAIEIPIVRTKADGNYVRVRRKATKKRETFELNYKFLTLSDYQSFRSFFIENQGSVMTWTHPVHGSSHNVVFAMDKLEATLYDTYADLTVLLEEL